MVFQIRGRRVWVAGHNGMVGAALLHRLEGEGCELITVGRAELDLRDQTQVRAWMAVKRPEVVFMAAARVGGILANAKAPVDFLYDNLIIQANVIEAAFAINVQKMLFLGSSCIYPKFAPQPIPEGALLTGSLEPTNEWYAIAKISGLKLCQAYRQQYGRDFISAMPTNLYGPRDNFDLETSHVLPALIRKTHEAKLASQQGVTIWGTGTPRREFLHVYDCADALIHLMKTYSDDQHVNVGAGNDLTICDLARQVASAVGFSGSVEVDPSKPDGTPRKLMDSSRLRTSGWAPRIRLEDGLRATYSWFLDNVAS